MASYNVRQLARDVQVILDAVPDPAAAHSIYLDERYRGRIAESGIRLPDVREREAIDAGNQAEAEFQRNYRKPVLSFFRNRQELERRFDESKLEARKAGMRAYFVSFVTEELASVSDPAILQDLGTYLMQVASDLVGTEGILLIIRDVAEAIAIPRMIADRMAPLILGVARAKGYRADDVIANKDNLFQDLANGLPPKTRTVIHTGVVRVRDMERQEENERNEAVSKAKRSRYRRTAELLASVAEEEEMRPEDAAEMVAQVFIRTSEGRSKMSDEFRSALIERFSDPGFGDRVVQWVIQLKQEREGMRDDLDWNAGNITT
jgi:hypothetical protein